MEFLKELLGEELYSQIEAKINEHNGNEANKDKQVKLGNLATGEYVSKGKFDGISAELTSKTSELEKANSLIEDTEFTGESFDGTTAYYEKYEGYGGDIIGSTKDGTKVTITPEYTDIEVDGILVKMEGLTQKVGEKATIEAVVLDITPDNLKTAINGNANYTGSDTGSTDPNVTSKSWLDEGDYISNLALVANRIGSNDKTIIWFKKALCTSGLDLDMKNKSVAGNKYTFEAYAEQSDVNVDTLPIEIIVMKKIT